MCRFNIHASYFSVGNPLQWLDRRLNKFEQSQTIRLNHRDLVVSWTRRADKKMQVLQKPLIIELQLYFSCVVKKRVLFHQQVDFETVRVGHNIEIAFRPVASAACDPDEFARHYPEGKTLLAPAASKMVPKRVEFDFRRDQWEGQFGFG